MRLRVTDAMRSELVKVRDSNRAVKGGVMVAPGILSIEAWEAIAEPHQRALMEWSMETHSGAQVRNELPAPMTAAQERAFEAHVEASKRQAESITEEQRAARAYAKATGIIR